MRDGTTISVSDVQNWSSPRDGWCPVVYVGGEWHPAHQMDNRRVYAEMDAADIGVRHIGCYDENVLIGVCPVDEE